MTPEVAISNDVILSAFATSVGVIGILISVLARIMVKGIYDKIESCHEGLKERLEETHKLASSSHIRQTKHLEEYHTKKGT